ncbi:MAG TPA: SHOCT domain-containing protein [Rugosimonospora sp.]|nr:SHOCT domain-containing protein [Rugosimonospora sp.]
MPFIRPGGALLRGAAVAGTTALITRNSMRNRYADQEQQDQMAQMQQQLAQQQAYQQQQQYAAQQEQVRQQQEAAYQAGMAAAQAGGTPAAGATTPAAGGGADVMAQLQQLAQLRSQGLLTDDEFAAAKAKLLG